MKKILILSICVIAFFACKKEDPKTIITPEPEVDYREKYIGEYNCQGEYRIIFDDIDSASDYVDMYDIHYNVLKSGDSSIVFDGNPLKIEKDGYFGPRNYNQNFDNPPHGKFYNDSIMSYSKDNHGYDTTYGSYIIRYYIGGVKKK